MEREVGVRKIADEFVRRGQTERKGRLEREADVGVVGPPNSLGMVGAPSCPDGAGGTLSTVFPLADAFLLSRALVVEGERRGVFLWFCQLIFPGIIQSPEHASLSLPMGGFYDDCSVRRPTRQYGEQLEPLRIV